MYKMVVASYVTEENYGYAKEEVVEFIDYVLTIQAYIYETLEKGTNNE